MLTVAFDGKEETKTIRQWEADPRCNVTRQTICNRLDAGDDPHTAVTAPAARGSSRKTRVRAPQSSPGAERVAAWCTERSVGVAEFADAIGLTYSTVLAMLKGDHVSYSTVFKAAVLMGEDPVELAKAFGLPVKFSLKSPKSS